MKKLRTLKCLLVCSLVCVYLGFAASAYSDAVVDWNAIAIQTIVGAVPPRPGPTGALDIAMVHLAVHNAVAAIDGGSSRTAPAT